MNLQFLLHKLSNHQTDYQSEKWVEGHSNKVRSKQIKTSQSVGTLHSFNGELNQRSFVINEGISPIEALKNHVIATKPQMFRKDHNKNHISNFSLRSQNQESVDTNNSRKMELAHRESGKTLNQSKNSSNCKRSGQYSGAISRSKQKHILRPSNTPSFSKFLGQNIQKDKLQITPRVVDFGEKNTEPTKQLKVYSNSPPKMTKPQHMDTEQYYKVDSGQHRISHQNYISDQSGNLHEQLPIQPQGKEIDRSSSVSYQADQLSIQKQNNSIIHSNHICSCHERMNQFQRTNHIYTLKLEKIIKALTSRVQQLEISHTKLIHNHETLNRLNSKQTMEVQSIKSEKQRAQHQRNQWKTEKQELEQILKEVLYKRERQKLHGMKQNAGKIQNGAKDYPKPQKALSTRQHSESKMKVQNLLQKLQIKVQRT